MVIIIGSWVSILFVIWFMANMFDRTAGFERWMKAFNSRARITSKADSVEHVAEALDLGKISVGPPYFGLLFPVLMAPLIAMAFGSKDGAIPPELVKKLSESLASLPPSMQELFVERLVAITADPDAFKTHVDAVTALAAAAADEANKRSNDANVDSSDYSVELPVAAATLGAFLTQYSAAMTSAGNDQVSSIVPMEL